MLLAIVVIFTALMALEMQIDTSHENRIINPMTGLVVTLLASSFIYREGGPDTTNLQMVHVILYIACLLYVRAMLDFVFRYFF